MTDQIEEFDTPFKVTLKGGAGFEKPWIVISANTADEAVARLAEAQLAGLLEKTAEFAADFQAKTGAAPQGAPAQTGSPSRSSQAPARQAQSAAPTNKEYHPEGLTCGVPNCGQAIFLKHGTSRAGNKFQVWTCPNQKTKGDGHYSQYVN